MEAVKGDEKMRKIKYDEFIKVQKRALKKYTVLFFFQGYRYIILTDSVEICQGEPYTLSEFYLKINPKDILVHAVRPDRDNFNAGIKSFYVWGELTDNRTDWPVSRTMLGQENYKEILGGDMCKQSMCINKEVFEKD